MRRCANGCSQRNPRLHGSLPAHSGTPVRSAGIAEPSRVLGVAVPPAPSAIRSRRASAAQLWIPAARDYPGDRRPPQICRRMAAGVRRPARHTTEHPGHWHLQPLARRGLVPPGEVRYRKNRQHGAGRGPVADAADQLCRDRPGLRFGQDPLDRRRRGTSAQGCGERRPAA